MRAYEDMVFTTAARLTGNDAQAEDISQQVFLKAYEHFAELTHSPTPGGWLKTVATNLSLNHLSRYRKRWRFFSELRPADSDDEPEFDVAGTDCVVENVGANLDRAAIEQALAQLPDQQRIPLVLFHFEDMPYDEIASRLQISLSKVKTDILRGRAALAKVFNAADFAFD